jgi:hypothetical protein
MRGLNHVHKSATATGMTAHHPSQSRLQNAMMSSGSAVLRRIPLHGLAWAHPGCIIHPEQLRNRSLKGHTMYYAVLCL